MRDSRPVRSIGRFVAQPLRLLSDDEHDPLPPNPELASGVRVMFMGTSRKRIEGPATGYVYHAAPERREIVVAAADIAAVLATRAFVRADPVREARNPPA